MRCLFVLIWYIFFFPLGREVFVGQCEMFVCLDLAHFFFFFLLAHEAHRSANEVSIL